VSSGAATAAALEVFFAALEPSVVLAGALEAVPLEAGALPAVDAGLGAMNIDNRGQRVRVVCRRDNELSGALKAIYIVTRDFVTICLRKRRVTDASGFVDC